MSQNDRIAMFPSRANLVLMKQRIVGATRGLNLLKRKRDALELKLRELTASLRKVEEVVDDVMDEAIFSISKANYLNADLKPASIMNVDRADIFMRIRNNKVAGLQLPTFELFISPSHCFPLTGLSRGGEQVEVVRKKFQEAVKMLIALASLKFSVQVMENGVRQNNMRINGLDYVVIPRFTNTVNYIRDELEEYEREDFYRLKRSQGKQRKAKEKFTKMIQMRTHRLSNGEAPSDKRHSSLPMAMDQIFDIENFGIMKPEDVMDSAPWEQRNLETQQPVNQDFARELDTVPEPEPLDNIIEPETLVDTDSESKMSPDSTKSTPLAIEREDRASEVGPEPEPEPERDDPNTTTEQNDENP